MPNRTNNHFSASSDDTELMVELHDKLINENNHLDFNLAVPMPEELDLPWSPIKVIEDHESKEEKVSELYPRLVNPEWLEGKTQEQIDTEFNNCLKTIQTKSENQAIKDKNGTDDRYHWSIQNRGCKWNVDGEVGDTINDDHTEINFSFDTPRSPPTYWFAALCKMFPEISMSLDYEEPGMGFEGTMESNGEGGYRDDQREYQETCNHCDEKDFTAKRYDEAGESVCDACLAEIVPEEMHLYQS